MTKSSLSVSQNGKEKESNGKSLNKSSSSSSSNSLNKSTENANSSSSSSGSGSPNTTTTTTTTTTTSTTANQQQQEQQEQEHEHEHEQQQSNPSLFNFGAHYDSLCNMIIRPPRYTYSLDDLGPKAFSLGHPLKTYVRNDFELINPRGHSIQCSHFKQSEYWETGEKQPCVIYCHGNSGCRLDAMECVRTLLPMNITVLVFDFSGSGLSGGQYVSLGYFEKEDVGVIVKHLRDTGKISTIGLWGRSMGAVTSILYAREDPSIAGMVLDSPFSSLYKVAEELVHSAVQKLPKLMISLGLKMVRGSIKKRAHFDIKELDVLNIADQVYIPALFAHGESDNFVRPHHSEKLFEKYNGDKNRLLLKGGHNSERPNFFLESVCIFFQNTLKPNQDDSNDSNDPKGPEMTIHELFRNPELLFDDCSVEEQKMLFVLYQQQQQKKKQQQQQQPQQQQQQTSTSLPPPSEIQSPHLIVTEPSIYSSKGNGPLPPPASNPTPQQLQQNDFSFVQNSLENNNNNNNNNINNNNNNNNNTDNFNNGNIK
ncbi:hypothetical protein ACTFIW_011758 [Dictyostelium discoideum]